MLKFALGPLGSAALISALLVSTSAFALCDLAQNENANTKSTTPSVDFTDNGDGTVTHKVTGLTWKRCSVGQIWNGSTCTGTAATYTWSAALALGSSQGWRLPNRKELRSIVEERCMATLVNWQIFPQTPATSFWSSTPWAGGVTTNSVTVSFWGGGTMSTANRTSALPVRLVQGP